MSKAHSVVDGIAALNPTPGASGGQVRVRRPLVSAVPLVLRDEDAIELTPGQLLMWLGQQYAPDVPAYNQAILCRIDGPLNMARFQGAFQRLVDLTDALRVSVGRVNDGPRQWFRQHVMFDLELLDLYASRDPVADLRRTASRRVAESFDLGTRLFDSFLARVADNCFFWWLGVHHLVTDLGSFALLHKRIAALYELVDTPDAVNLPNYPTFADYVAGQLRLTTTDRYGHAKAYWERTLSAQPEPPRFYGRPPGTGAAVVCVRFPLGSARTRKLRARAARHPFAALSADASLLATLATTLAVLIKRTTGSADFSLGIPFHNRASLLERETVGSLMVVCPIRVHVGDSDTFDSVAHKIRIALGEAMRYAQYPVRNPPGKRVYDALLNLYTVEFGDFAGLPATTTMMNAGHELQTLTVNAETDSERDTLTLSFEFNREVFDARARAAAVAAFRLTLDALLADSTIQVAAFDVLPRGERAVVLARTRGPERYQAGEEGSVPVRISRRAAEAPDHPAVICGLEIVSYGELEARANRLGRYLRHLDVGAEVPVGVFLDRSPDAIVAFLAIMKAGGAYVPLDPSYPRERLELVLRELRPSIVITRGQYAQAFRGTSVRPVCLDADAPSIATESADAEGDGPWPEAIAYVMYTSGSSGKPRGVMIEHRSLANYTEAARELFVLRSSDRVLQFAPLSFDTSAEEIFPCLASGATLVLRTDDLLDSPAGFFRKCRDLRLTVLDLPTSYWHVLSTELHAIDPSLLADLRVVICGGEAASAVAARRWRERLSSTARLINTYGPTEATIVTTTYEVPETSEFPSGNGVPIGRPIRGARAYVLNAGLQLVPPGTPGELYAGGVGLARGYADDVALTAERFVPDPFAAEAGARLYKTGDYVRSLPDGTLQFLGRVDRQLKVRGFRVEPGEVEAVITRHPGVAAAAVTALLEVGADASPRLVAFVEPRSSWTTLDDLNAFARQHLPEYMVPSRFVVVPGLPMTLNGKVDYAALRAQQTDDALAASRPVRALTPEEAIIAETWAAVLGLEPSRIGAQDDFFRLGGHSLHGALVMSRINRAFGVEVPLRALFEAPTIEGLLGVIARTQLARVDVAESARLLAEVELTPDV